MVNVTKSTLIAGSQSTGGRSCKCMYKPEPPDFQVLGWGGEVLVTCLSITNHL